MEIDQSQLLNLFNCLRQEGLPLGIDEYRLLLQAVEGGFGTSDRAALARLCRTLWVKSPRDQRIFDYHFKQLFSQADSLPEGSGESVPVPQPSRKRRIFKFLPLAGVLLIAGAIALTQIRPREPDTPTPTEPPTPVTSPEPTTSAPQQSEVPTAVAIANQIGTSPFFSPGVLAGGLLGLTAIALMIREFRQQSFKPQLVQEELTEEVPTPYLAVLPAQPTETTDEIETAQLIQGEGLLMGDQCLPITRRQMKQSWRYLRRLMRLGRPTELDIQATIHQLSYQGMLLSPVLVPRRVNRTQLLLLVDHDGSMMPFHRLARRLVETTTQGKLGKVNIYYFHNCPIEHLYCDLAHQNAKPIDQVWPQLDKRWTVAMIFSDAGALRGSFSAERIQQMTQFLEQLQSQVRHITWLNPVPSERWPGTTAGEIARLVPMFDTNRRGFQQAINVMRGSSKV